MYTYVYFAKYFISEITKKQRLRPGTVPPGWRDTARMELNNKSVRWLLGCLALVVLLACLRGPSGSQGSKNRVTLVSEDTRIDKALFAGPHRMCCSAVEWPCCQHQSCCEVFEQVISYSTAVHGKKSAKSIVVPN
jgi:hypothetical protein